MATIIIRRLEDSLKSRLRVRAAQHGRSMEEAAREILRAGLAGEPARKLNLAQAIRRRIDPLGGVELALPSRGPVRRPPKLTK
jgi:plasmid stability protein